MSSITKDIPTELQEKLAKLDRSLTKLEEDFNPLLSTSQEELQTKFSPLEQAKLDLVSVYAVNSLFWAYLNTCGLDPMGKGVKTELDRIRSYMNRVKEIEDKAKAPKINADAAKRFVKNALWQSAQNKSQAGPSKDVSDENEDVEHSRAKFPKNQKNKNKKGKKRFGKKRD